MKDSLTKRDFLQISSVGGVAAVLGLLTGATAEATEASVADRSAELELAEAITAISYIGGLAFVVAAIYKFKQHKDNPTQDPHDPLRWVSALWVLIDDSTVTALTEWGYSPQFLVDAVESARDGDTSNLLAFFSDLNRLA